MKVAVLSSHTPSLFWFRMDMMREFIARGHQVFALANGPEEEWSGKFRAEGIDYRQIRVERNGTDPMGDLKTFFSIRSALDAIKPDALFLYQAKTIIYGAIAARRCGKVPAFPLIAGVGSVFLSDDRRSRIVRAILTAEYRYALAGCGTIFFQNPDDVDVFRKHRIITNQNIVMLHGSGVNTDSFPAQPQPERPAFLYIGRLIRDKGVYEYLEACRLLKAKYPKTRCMLVGPFDSNPSALKREELRPFLRDGVIEYFGEQKDVRPYLRQCSVFVLPSYREGTPKTILEAMSSGRAVITTDAPGCKETVRNGENGYLVPIKDVEALYRSMEGLLLAPEKAAEMGAAGRRMAEDVFDVRKVDRVICSTMGL